MAEIVRRSFRVRPTPDICASMRRAGPTWEQTASSDLLFPLKPCGTVHTLMSNRPSPACGRSHDGSKHPQCGDHQQPRIDDPKSCFCVRCPGRCLPFDPLPRRIEVAGPGQPDCRMVADAPRNKLCRKTARDRHPGYDGSRAEQQAAIIRDECSRTFHDRRRRDNTTLSM